MRQQLLVFADDLRSIVGQERTRRQEAELAVRELHSSYLAMVKALARAAEMKDRHTSQHLERTYQYAMALTRRVAPELAEEATIGYGYLLHDVGKVGVPDSVLNKPGPLTEQEWAVMRTHPVIGEQMVAPIRFLGDAVHVIKSHHERWDGKGYPTGLAGEDIHLCARIFSIIDSFDAMTSNRPYRRAMPVHAALEEIERHAGTQFDPDIARAFTRLCQELDLVDADALTFVR